MAQSVSVVTGAAGGMGSACARAIARPGEALVLADMTERVADVAAELADTGAPTHPIVCDVSDRASVARLAELVASVGSPRAIVHAAGTSPSMGDWASMFRVNLVGTALVVEALRGLATKGTAAVCFSSNAAHIAQPDTSCERLVSRPLAPDLFAEIESDFEALQDSANAYAWAKRGVILLVNREAAAWGRRGARIVSVSPGLIDTAMGHLELANQPGVPVLLSQTPAGRMGTPEDVAAVVTFLVSDAAGYVTGTDVLVDGGAVLAGRRLMERSVQLALPRRRRRDDP